MIQPALKPQIQDIPYLGKTGPGMDAWLPRESGGKVPACILIHGGGWTTGDKADARECNIASRLCSLGYAVFSINYHMAEYEEGPYNGVRKVCAWPGCIADSMDAVSYVRANASLYHVNPQSICAVGSSAGGHLALLIALAADDKRLQSYRLYPDIPCGISCVISLYGVTDIRTWGGELLMPEPYETMKEEWALASPAGHLNHTPPPIMLVHGDSDETVDVKESIRFYNQLFQKNYITKLMIIPGGRHSFDFSAFTPKQYAELTNFLNTYLGKGNTI